MVNKSNEKIILNEFLNNNLNMSQISRKLSISRHKIKYILEKNNRKIKSWDL